MSNWSGGGLPLIAIGYVLFVCVGYSLSDLNIKVLIEALLLKNIFIGTLVAVSLSYVTNGFICLIAFLFLPQLKFSQIKPALPYAVVWFIAMVLLFGCFGIIGPLFGNIVQSSRGIMAVILGIVIARVSDTDLEQKLAKPVLIRRIIAAGFITGAVVLYACAEKLS